MTTRIYTRTGDAGETGLIGGKRVAKDEQRMQVLKRLKDPQEADRNEFKTLEERVQLLSEQLERANQLLTQNEIAITKMDKLNVALATVKTGAEAAALDLNSAIRDMEDLAKRVHHYNA